MPKHLEEMRKKISENLQGKTNPRTKKPYSESDIYAIAVAQYKKKYGSAPSKKESADLISEMLNSDMSENEDYADMSDCEDLELDMEEAEEVMKLDNKLKGIVEKIHVAKSMELFEKKGKSYLFSDKIEIKSHEGKYYVEGYISSTNPDLGMDIVEDTALKEIVDAINSKNIKLGYMHQEIKGDPRIIPIGRAVSAELIQNKAFAKFILNDKSPFWQEVQSGIEGKFYDAFSIEYLPKLVDYKNLNGNKYRQLKSIKLVGIALTGRPMNEDSLIQSFYAKELNFNNMEENMETTTVNVQEEPGYKEYLAYKKDTEAKEQKNKLEAEMKSFVDSEVKSILAKSSPLTNAGTNFDGAIPVQVKHLMETSQLRVDQSLPLPQARSKHLEILRAQTKAATELMNTPLGESIVRNFYASGVPMIQQKNWEVNGRRIEYKANLLSTTNSTTYSQSAAELNDVYGPIIYNQLNDVTTFWGTMPKEDMSQYQKIQFRAKTARNSSAGGYLEDATTWTPQVVTREKYEQAFCHYRVIMQVSGQAMAFAQGVGGVGDLWTKEVEDSARDLLKQINLDLLTGTSGNTFDGSVTNKVLGLQHLCLGTGTLYGLARATFTLLQGNQEAMSSANLSLTQLRKMIRTVVVDGARQEDLVFYLPPLQKDKYLAILQAGQVFQAPTSARAGFEGNLEFDGVPLVVDVDADTDDVFLVDQGSTRIGIKLGPQLEPLYLENYDGRKAFIKVYYNLYSTNPKRNYHSSGFATS